MDNRSLIPTIRYLNVVNKIYEKLLTDCGPLADLWVAMLLVLSIDDYDLRSYQILMSVAIICVSHS